MRGAWDSRTPTLTYHGQLQKKLILSGLNDDDVPDRRAELRKWVEFWNRCGRRADLLLKRAPDLDRYLHRGNDLPWRVIPCAGGSGLRLVFLLVPSQSHIAPWEDVTVQGLDRESYSPRQLFVALLLHPDRDKLSERPCGRCGRYFFKNSGRQKIYCSRKCGKDGTAAYATKKRLRAEHEGKLQVATEEIRRWLKTGSEQGWKTWISKQPAGRRVGLTPKFLTRAVNKGELIEPKKKGER